MISVGPSRLSNAIDDTARAAIGSIVIEFAAMEASAEFLIWALLNLPAQHGTVLTKMDARPKFELLRKLLEERPQDMPDGPFGSELWRALDDSREKRNRIAYNQWAMLDGTNLMLVRLERNKTTGAQYGE